MAFVQTVVAEANAATTQGGGGNYVFETNAGVLYLVYIDSALDVVFSKSTDGGKTWSAGTAVFTGSAVQVSAWFDRHSGISGGLIHCAYAESATDDVFYRSIDTANADSLSSQTTIFAGASTAGTTSSISIARTRGGNLLCVGTFDGGTESWAKKSTNVGANWGDISSPMEGAANDTILLAPGFAADNQDALAIFWDSDASEVSRKIYDDSGDSWAETSIAGTMTTLTPGTAFPNMAIAPDLANSQLVMVVWSANDLANADLRCFTITESAITETANNVIQNSSDDQSLCAISIDTTNNDWYAFYCGITGGTQTAQTFLSVCYKVSTDDGATWGSEQRLSGVNPQVVWLITNPRMVYLSAEVNAAIFSTATPNSIHFMSIMPTLPPVADVETGVQYGINGVEYTGTLSGGGGGSIFKGGIY